MKRMPNSTGCLAWLGTTLVLLLSCPTITIAGSAVEAEPVVINLQVNGLTCPFCAYGLEKKLHALPGASDISIDINEGRVVMVIKGMEIPDWTSVQEAVKKAGFTPGKVEYVVIGRIDGEKRTIQLANGKRVIQFRFETDRAAGETVKDQGLYRLRGVLKRLNEGQAEFVVSAIKEIEEARDSG